MKIIIRIIIVISAIVILSLILLPGIAKKYASKHSKELVGRQIVIDKLRINYFTGTLKVTDFKMFEEDDNNVFVSFDTLIINLEPYQLFVDEFVIEQLYLKGLKASVTQQDSMFNFDDLIAFNINESDTVEVDPILTEPLHFQLSNIELKDAEFIFDDRIINKITKLNDISFFIPYVGWNQADKSKADLRFALKNEGYFESSINVNPVNGNYDAEIILWHLYFKSMQEYVAEFANINAFGGLFNAQIKMEGNIFEPEQSLVSGSAEVIDFMMADENNNKFLGANKLECVIKEFDIYNQSYIIDSLILNEPYVYFEMDSTTNNFFEIFNIGFDEDTKIDSSNSNTNTATESEDLYYALNYFNISKGVVDYTDNLTGDPFDYNLSEIEITTDSIFSNSDWININSTMLLNNRGELVAEVGFDPANPMDIILDYVVTDFQLSDLNIYSRYYMGFPILYGDMYYKSRTKIINNQLTSENRLIINNAEVGDKTGGLYSLPMKFALFILKDRDGVIDLDIPVRGNLDDPQVSVGKIVWNTFKNLIVKVAASPFDLLAGLISVNPKDIKVIEFGYLDTTLSAEHQQQIDHLLQLEHKKEDLEIELVYFNDVNIEKEQIAVAEAGKLFAAKTNKNYKTDNVDFLDFLKSKTETDSVDIVAASEILIPPTTIDSLLSQFAETRKNGIEQYLVNANDSTAITISVSSSESPKNIGIKPIFEVKYSMKVNSDVPDQKK
ncbi:MAG: DUF748 domain-containing protein [Draconibacterium sp.]|nr:DUF748 domain-containing protein [Draconibacterium sp.]